MAEQELVLPKTSYRTFFLVWLILLALLALTVAAAQLHWTGSVVLAALAIATLKAGLVAVYFMHLREEPWILKGMLVFVFLVLALLILLTFSDELYRKG